MPEHVRPRKGFLRAALAAAPLLLAPVLAGCTPSAEERKPCERPCPDRKPLPILY